jgi:hypothetical protein
VAQGVGPEFKPQYRKKRKRNLLVTIGQPLSPSTTQGPMGTIGFSQVFQRNFSLKPSKLLYKVGLKPLMTGGYDGSKGASRVAGPGGDMFGATVVGENSDAKLCFLKIVVFMGCSISYYFQCI